MSRRVFDSATKQKFQKAQELVKMLDAMMLSKDMEEAEKTEITNQKKAIQNAVKELKKKFYLEDKTKVLSEAKSFVSELLDMKVSNMYKL